MGDLFHRYSKLSRIREVLYSEGLLNVIRNSHNVEFREETWTHGACGVLAFALKALIPEGQLVVVMSSRESASSPEHVALQISGYIIDGDGMFLEADYITRIQNDPQNGPNPRLVSYTGKQQVRGIYTEAPKSWLRNGRAQDYAESNEAGVVFDLIAAWLYSSEAQAA